LSSNPAPPDQQQQQQVLQQQGLKEHLPACTAAALHQHLQQLAAAGGLHQCPLKPAQLLVLLTSLLQQAQ
jgi:hypothetical protein